MSTTTRRLALCAALAFGAAPLLVSAADKDKPKSQTFTGKVVPLASLVKKIGSELDKDAAPHWVALVTTDDKVYPLIKENASRMFFKDEKLLNRPMRVTGRLLPGSQMLQVLEVRSLLKGKPHDVYYWCDICAIRRTEKNDCDCCGAPLELREDELGK